MGELPAIPKIADVGSGTGAFLRFVREIRPEAELHGFDLNPALFPNLEDRLSWRTEHHIMDARLPVPEIFQNTFDMVHVRMLSLKMSPVDWGIVIFNLSSMLKPGGLLQWVEGDENSIRHLRTGDCVRHAAHAHLMNEPGFHNIAGDEFRQGWAMVPGFMQMADMTCIVRDVVSSDRLPWTRQQLSELELNGPYSRTLNRATTGQQAFASYDQFVAT